MKKMGKIYGVGVGPGAVDLLSVRADKLVREAKYIAFFRKAGRAGHARQIASILLSKDVIELAMEYPILLKFLCQTGATVRCYPNSIKNILIRLYHYHKLV